MSPRTVEATQSFIVRQECEQAAFCNGFRRVLGETKGWAAYASTTARGTIHLAAAGIHGPWFLALTIQALSPNSACLATPCLAPAVPATLSTRWANSM
jgi:hypothetical protein